jgi:hypothetical protein
MLGRASMLALQQHPLGMSCCHVMWYDYLLLCQQ